eukprot:COSAG02_NODE_5071_length_4668_cov_3.398555_1_plen_66_part_00
MIAAFRLRPIQLTGEESSPRFLPLHTNDWDSVRADGGGGRGFRVGGAVADGVRGRGGAVGGDDEG